HCACGADADGGRSVRDQSLRHGVQGPRQRRRGARGGRSPRLKIRFWGTRGSIPVSVTAAQVRRKVIAALSGAAGRNLDSAEAIERYVDELPFEVRGTFGGHSSCVELETGGPEHVIFDMGS